MTQLPRHSVSVTGVVFREDGRVLAIQRSDDGRWVPPGGVLEMAETPPDGVTREVLEETASRCGPISSPVRTRTCAWAGVAISGGATIQLNQGVRARPANDMRPPQTCGGLMSRLIDGPCSCGDQLAGQP